MFRIHYIFTAAHWDKAVITSPVLCAQSCLTFCSPMDGSSPGSSVHGIFQARILEQRLPWWSVVKNPPANAGPTGSILIQEGPTCHRTTKLRCHIYWAYALKPESHNYWAHVPQLLKPTQLEPMLCNRKGTARKSSPYSLHQRKVRAAGKTQHSQNKWLTLLKKKKRILEQIAISYSRVSSWPRDWTHISCIGR